MSYNSINRSGMSAAFIREIECLFSSLPPGLIRALGVLLS